MPDSMRDIGTITKEMEKDLKDILMEILISECSKMEKHMEREFIHGPMDKFMMESGTKDLNMDMVYGKESITIAILESGIRVEPMGMVFILGQMETDMRESGTCV